MTTAKGRLLEDPAPLTCQNFRSYYENGDFSPTVIHRYYPNFVYQMGSTTFDPNGNYVPVTPGEPVPSEVGVPSTAGTLAMALGADTNGVTDPNSGTNQWFVNLSDNPHLDSDFTVFAELTEGFDSILSILNYIDTNSLVAWDTGSGLTDNYTATNGFSPYVLVVTDDDSYGWYPMYTNVTLTPEPAALALLSTGGLALLRRRRRASGVE